MNIKIIFTLLIGITLFSCTRARKENQKIDSSDNSPVNNSLTENKDRAGENLYFKYCMACHQTDGSGVPGMYPPLINSPTVNSGDKDAFIKILLNGLRGPIIVHGKKYNQQMPSQNFLSDEELALIINYVSNSFQNKGPEVSPEDVKALRKN